MKIIKRLSIALIAVLTITSCSDNFFDVDKDQNNPTFSTPELSLPAAQKQSVDVLSGGNGSLNALGNFWTYTWAAGGDFAFYEEETQYIINSSLRGNTFTGTYLGTLSNYDVIEKNTNPAYSNYKAIAMIMKAFHFQYLVDVYGDVPYSEALVRANNPTPKYDAGQDIYNDLLVKLTAAQDLIANPDANAIAPGAKDIMCGGDMAKWARFANTIKLRILLRQSNIGVTDYSSVNNGIGFLGAGETVFSNPGYIDRVAGKQNPMYNGYKIDDAGNAGAFANATRATPFALSRFDNTDPRKPLYWLRVGTNYVGIEQNGIGGLPSTALSGIGNGILKSSTMPGIIMQSAESFFLQAEAAARGFISGNAQALYNAGVQEAYTQVGAGSSATATLAGGIYEYPTGGTLAQRVQTIYKQKFIALMSTNGIENWIETRRIEPIGADAVPVARNLQTGVFYGPTIPVRLFYPVSEYSNNADNVPALSSGDEFTKKVFWDNN